MRNLSILNTSLQPNPYRKSFAEHIAQSFYYFRYKRTIWEKGSLDIYIINTLAIVSCH